MALITRHGFSFAWMPCQEGVPSVAAHPAWPKKDVDLLKKFLTEQGKILPRRMTGLTARQQRI